MMLALGTDHVRLGLSPINATLCQQGTGMSQELADFIGQDHVVSITYCKQKPFFFIDNGWIADITLSVEKRGNKTVTKGLNVPVNKRGIPVEYTTPDTLIALALIIVGGAWWASNHYGQTPGKMLLGIAITPTTRKTLLKREFIKWSPIVALSILLFGASVILNLLSLEGKEQIAFLQQALENKLYWAVAAIVGLAFLAFYLSPVFNRNRLSIWDRAAGTTIERF